MIMMDDTVKEYILKLEDMIGYLAEELNKHSTYTPRAIVQLNTELAILSEELRDDLDD